MQVRSFPGRARRQRGVTLIIALIMLVIIGLTAAAAMRSAVSSEKMINNVRSEAMAQQYAEIGLRYCEREMAKASASRNAKLADALIATVAAGGPPKWQRTDTWIGATPPRVVVPEAEVRSADSSAVPASWPQCYVEKQTLPDGSTAMVITARGFSPDYQADAATGNTLAGAVVWLQSISAFN